MSEYQKMISSQQYNCMAPELALLRREAARRYRRFNQAEEEAEQRALLADLVGELAENAFICPPLYCTYGRHIQLGKDSYINMGSDPAGQCPHSHRRPCDDWAKRADLYRSPCAGGRRTDSGSGDGAAGHH